MIRTPLLKIFALSVIIFLPVSICAFAETSAPPSVTISSAEIGFNQSYKLGCWTPLTIELSGGSQTWSGQVRATVPDTDGVPTHVFSSVTVAADENFSVQLFVRMGQSSSPINVALLDEEKKTIAQRNLYLGANAEQNAPGGFPATNRILLEVGNALALDQLILSEKFADTKLTTRVANVETTSHLPTQWNGYESIDTVLLTTSQPAAYDALRQDTARVEALQQWVQRGGRLFLFCGEYAEQLIAAGSVLERFAPGKFEKMERLTQAQPLATFSGSEQAITRNRRLNLRVPSLVDVRGEILASAGRSATSVPLVIRSRYGFGEIVFVGLDFDSKPLSDWPGRTSFLKRLFDWQDRDPNQQTTEQQDIDDTISHLRNALDKQFVGVSVVPFGIVALLAGIYILLIGPGDYFFVTRLLKRPALTWLTFPIVVLGISAIAYAIGTHSKGNQLRVNQVEIIDVDCTTDDQLASTCGTVYTHLFTPAVDSLNLQLQGNYFKQPLTQNVESRASWLGLPGSALGGMQASGSQTAIFEEGYRYAPQLDQLQRLPVQAWSTKTLTARWFADVEPQVKIDLQQDSDELVIGSITNNSEVELTDCALLYGRWAYNLGNLAAQRTIRIDDSRQPRTVKTLLTNATAGDETVKRTAADGTVPFSNARWDVARLLKAMMFFRAVNGPQYTKLIQRYQPFLDLSKHLEDKQIAILLARVDGANSQWQIDNAPMQSDQDQHWTYYRFVAKVSQAEQ